METSVEQLKDQFCDFEDATNEARAQSEKARDYRDLKQWTAEEIATLEKRGQAPLVIPKIPAKVDFLVGLERQQRADPRAFPRTPEHEEAADAATDAIRFVADNVDFDQVASLAFEHGCIVEGYAAAIIEPVLRRNQVEIDVNFIPFDRFYFDPHSRRLDFKDADFMGMVTWMDISKAKRLYPDAKEKLSSIESQCVNGTFEDKPKWLNTKSKRVKVCQHYFIQEGVWHCAHFTDGAMLLEAKPCTLLNEFGEPDCPIEALSGYVDRNNNRYGLVHSLIGLQDEINHRRSKALHMLSMRQLWFEEGTVKDPNAMQRELSRPDGKVKFNPQALKDGRVQIQTMTDLAAGQTNLLAEAKAEIDSRGASSIIQGLDQTDLSGTAIKSLQNTAMLEIGPLMDAHRHWKRRCYRQIWNRIKQFWDEQRWIRVTDNEDNLKWVGLNKPVTRGEMIEQQMGQIPPEMQGDPRLNEVVEVQNNVAELDVDVIIDEAPDALTVQQEQFDKLAELAKVYGPQNVPFELMLRLSSLRNKDEIMEQLQGDPQMAAMQQQIQQIMQQLEMRNREAETAKTEAETVEAQADARRAMAEASQTELENELLQLFPDVQPNVNI